MHPAYSVIVFTTASGAGYGLLALIALGVVVGLPLPSRWFLPLGLGLALALIIAGLLSSTLHLGRPERAWRAFSQWRSSWLSIEGVLAVLTFAPAGLLFLAGLFGTEITAFWIAIAMACVVCAVATVYATSMIYASLATIRAWHNSWVAPNYLALGLASGGVLLVFIVSLFRAPDFALGALVNAVLIAAFALKLAYWREIDAAERTHTAEAATGLGQFGTVRPLDPPHTSANYIMQEMGYHVARKHADKLRLLTIAFAFAVPVVAILLAVIAGGWTATLLSGLAVASCGFGLLVERWLFFAQAQHVVTLYYGESTA